MCRDCSLSHRRRDCGRQTAKRNTHTDEARVRTPQLGCGHDLSALRTRVCNLGFAAGSIVAKVVKWLKSSHPTVGKGICVQKGDRIEFSTISRVDEPTDVEEAPIDFEGTIQGSAMVLRVLCHINGHWWERRYTLESVPNLD